MRRMLIMKKVVIIGAGPAGLTAAYELLERNEAYEIVVLEKSNMIGGISQTIKYGKNRMDIGGHRFFSKDRRIMDWWQKIMPLQGAPSFDDLVLARNVPLVALGPDPQREDRVMLSRNRVSRIYYKGHFFEYPISLKWSMLKELGFVTTLQVGFSYLKTIFHKLPETSLEKFYINSFGKKLYGMFFEGYTEKLWGRHPSKIDASWGAQRTKGLSIRGIIADMSAKVFMSKEKRVKKVQTSLIEEFHYPKFGPGQLWEIVAGEIEKAGGKILLNCEVLDIQTKNNQITKAQYQKQQEGIKEIEGDIFISSMPIKDLVSGMNNVPTKVGEIAKGLPYRDFVTVGLLVNKLNLKNETQLKTLGRIVPDCWIYVQDTEVKLGRIQIFNNWSPYLLEDPENTVWLGLEYFCDEGDEFWNMPEDECIKLAVKELVSMGIISNQETIIDSHRVCVQKAYPAYFDTYEDISEVVEYLNEYDNLYCVGRNGQHRYNNMDHSMATSFEVVKNIISGKMTKENIWNINTEKEYHEKK